MGNIEINDIIKFDNDKEYIVLSKTLYGKISYLYLINKDDYSIIFAAVSGNNVIVLNNKKDKILINELIPLFLKNITKMYLDLKK